MDTAGIPRDRQHLPLRVAAALLHIHIVGKSPDATDTRSLRATLNDLARALSMISPIYHHDPVSSLPVKIDESILTGATFDRGAGVLVAADGTRYEHLTIKRADLEIACKILGASTSLQERWSGARPT